MNFTLVVPGLNACSTSALAALPALRRLAVFAKAPATVADGRDAATLAALGLAAGTPAAPLRALGAGLAAGDDYVSAADPVKLTAGRDDVVLDGKVDDLAADEASAIVSALNAHFAADGLAFAAPRPDAWFVRSARVPRVVTTPLAAALGRPIYDHLPRGDDGKTWQRWQNEIQMLLHAHPVNAAREARGARPVTGLWFWGGGRLADVDTHGAVAAAAAPGDAGDLVRGFARHLGQTDDRPAESFEATMAHASSATSAVAALPAVAGDHALAALAAEWLVPAITALARGRLTSLDIVADGRGVTTRWHAPRPSRFARLTARWRGSRFVVPSPDFE